MLTLQFTSFRERLTAVVENTAQRYLSTWGVVRAY